GIKVPGKKTNKTTNEKIAEIREWVALGRRMQADDKKDKKELTASEGLAFLYQSAEWLTLQGFPNRPRHDSRWQTEGVCHGSRYSGADGLYRRRGSPVCPASETRCAGATAVSDCGRARGGVAGRGGEDRWHGSSDAAG